MLAREVVLKCQSPERSSAKRIAAFHRTMTHTRVHAKQKKVEQKRKIIHLLQECKATVVKNPRVAIYVTNNLFATSLANKKKKKQVTRPSLSLSLFFTQEFHLPRQSHCSAKQAQKFCGKVKILFAGGKCERQKSGEKMNMHQPKRFPAWVLVCFCQVAHRACSRNAESRALGPINAYTRALGHRSRPCANFRCKFLFVPRQEGGRRKCPRPWVIALALFRAHDGGGGGDNTGTANEEMLGAGERGHLHEAASACP